VLRAVVPQHRGAWQKDLPDKKTRALNPNGEQNNGFVSRRAMDL